MRIACPSISFLSGYRLVNAGQTSIARPVSNVVDFGMNVHEAGSVTIYDTGFRR